MTMIGVLLSQTNCQKSVTVSGVGPGTSVHKVFQVLSIDILYIIILQYIEILKIFYKNSEDVGMA